MQQIVIYGTRVVTEGLHAETTTIRQRERVPVGMAWAFETSKFNPCDIPPPTRTQLLIIPKQFANWGPSIQIMSAWSSFSFEIP